MAIIERPESATRNWINLLGVAGFFAGIWFSRQYGLRDGLQVWDVLLPVFGYALPILLCEALFLRTASRPSVGLEAARRDIHLGRFCTKMVGVYGSFAFIALLYWLFPEYHGGFYDIYWEALQALLPWCFGLAVPYIYFMDTRMHQPEDSYYAFGRLLTGHWRQVSRLQIIQHLLGWVIKGFFLPLMFVSISGNIRYMFNADFDLQFNSFAEFFNGAKHILFTLDLVAAVAGYALSLRLFDTHIRSSEPTLFGWVMCIICYQPMLSVFMTLYLSYSSNYWLDWLRDYPTLQMIWGSVALIALLIYTAASINFGCRFSNLTHRGIITNGMYRFSKHPAYLSKNLFWWMLHVPFIPLIGWGDSLRFSLLMAGIAGVYFLRARTEERHLSRDPVYVRYALWINEYGLLARLGRKFPFLRYQPPPEWEKLPTPYPGVKANQRTLSLFPSLSQSP